MITIRYTRVGKAKQPLYRLVVQEKSRDPWGKTLEIVGQRNPRTKELTLQEDRIKHWLSKGAQPSDSVWNMFVDKKLVEGKKHNVSTISHKRREKLAKKTS